MRRHNEDNDRRFVARVRNGIITVTKNGIVTNNKTGRLIGAVGSGRYPKISLVINGNICHMQIHRLVWLVYRGPIPQGFIVNHVDLNKQNPKLGNLELTTDKGNAEHAAKHGAPMNQHKGHKNGNAKFTRKQVLQMRRQFQKGEITVLHVVKIHGVSKTCAYWMLNGRTYK